MNRKTSGLAAQPACRGMSRLKEVSERAATDAIRRAIVRALIGGETDIDLKTGVTLVARGLTAAAENAGVSERTVQRQLGREGWTARSFAEGFRILAALELLCLGWRTERIARSFHYKSPAAFRRFLTRMTGRDLPSLRGSLKRMRNETATTVTNRDPSLAP